MRSPLGTQPPRLRGDPGINYTFDVPSRRDMVSSNHDGSDTCVQVNFIEVLGTSLSSGISGPQGTPRTRGARILKAYIISGYKRVTLVRWITVIIIFTVRTNPPEV